MKLTPSLKLKSNGLSCPHLSSLSKALLRFLFWGHPKAFWEFDSRAGIEAPKGNVEGLHRMLSLSDNVAVESMCHGQVRTAPESYYGETTPGSVLEEKGKEI